MNAALSNAAAVSGGHGPPAWLITLLVPSIGVCINTVMWLAPWSAVAKARQSEKLGTLNPYPFAITVVNCIGWVIYGCMVSNYFIFVANAEGLVLSLYYCMATMSIADKEVRGWIEIILIAGAALWSIIGMIAGMMYAPVDPAEGCLFVGYVASVFGMSYYGAGLTKLVEIVQERDSSSLHLPTILANTVNAVIWTSYGFFAIYDPNVYVVNGVGLIFCVVQLFFYIIFPRKKATMTAVSQRADKEVVGEVEQGGGRGDIAMSNSKKITSVDNPLVASIA